MKKYDLIIEAGGPGKGWMLFDTQFEIGMGFAQTAEEAIDKAKKEEKSYIKIDLHIEKNDEDGKYYQGDYDKGMRQGPYINALAAVLIAMEDHKNSLIEVEGNTIAFGWKDTLHFHDRHECENKYGVIGAFGAEKTGKGLLVVEECDVIFNNHEDCSNFIRNQNASTMFKPEDATFYKAIVKLANGTPIVFNSRAATAFKKIFGDLGLKLNCSFPFRNANGHPLRNFEKISAK